MLKKLEEKKYQCEECGLIGVKSFMLRHVCGQKYETATVKPVEQEMMQGGTRPSDGADRGTRIPGRSKRTSTDK
jgi:hypothetical protein